MRPFDMNLMVDCPKCGRLTHSSESVEYCAHVHASKGQKRLPIAMYGAAEDHLDITCSTCGYVQLMEAKNG